MDSHYLVRKILGSTRNFLMFLVLIVLFLMLGVGVAWLLASNTEEKPTTIPSTATLPEAGDGDVGVGGLDQKLTVNAQLQVNGQFYLAPSQLPSDAQAGTLVFDQATATLQYFNGSDFVSLTAPEEVVIPEAGVTSLQGQTGAIALVPGAGIAINGTTISSSGILGVNGVAGDVNVTTANGIASLSLPQSIAPSASPSFNALTLNSALPVSSGGTGGVSFTAHGVLIGNGTAAFGVVTAPAPGQCLLSTAGAPAFGACAGGGSGVSLLNGLSGNLSLSNATGVGSTITIDDASTSAKGIAQFNAANFSVAAGVVNTIQNIGTGATPTFAGLTLSAPLSVANGGTGRTTLAGDSLLLGNGVGAVNNVTNGTPGQCLIATSGAPVFATCTGDGVGMTGLSLAGTSGTPQAISDGNTITIAAGTNITTTAGATDTVTIATVASPNFTSLTLGTALGYGSGGTNATTAQGAINNLSGLTTNGDILYHNGTNSTRLARGTNGQCLLSTGTTIQWSTCTGAGGVSSVNSFTGVITVQGTANRVIVNNNSGVITLSTPQDINTSSSPTFAALNLGTALTIANGGTSATTQQAAINNLSGLTTQGDLLYHNGTNSMRLARGTNGQCLVSTGSSIEWATCTGDGVGITSLNGQTGTSQTFVNDTNVTITSGTNTHTLSWSGTLSVARGGTGANNATDARANLGVAASGANSDITSLSGLTTPLSVGQGGTGANSAQGAIDNLSGLTIDGDLLYHNGTNAVRLARGTNGQCLVSTGSSIEWTTCTGDGNSTYSAGDGLQLTGSVFSVDAPTCSGGQYLTWDGSNFSCGAPGGDGVGIAGLNLAGTSGTPQALGDGDTITIAAGSNIMTTAGATDTVTVAVVTNPTFSGLVTADGGLTLGAAQLLTIGGDAFSDLTGTGLEVNAGALRVNASTISTGTLALSNGGTGAATQQTAINNLSGLTTEGDLLYHNGTNSTRLARGTNGQCLISNASTILWGSCTGGTSDLTDAGAWTYLTSTTDEFVLGSSSQMNAKLAVVGTSDQTQLLIQANATQTSPLILAQNSSGTELFRINAPDEYNLLLGAQAGSSGGIGVGRLVLSSNTTGYSNLAFGNLALQNNTEGYSNYAFGYSALQANTTGANNTAIGNNALLSNETGSNNIALGNGALYSNTESDWNIAIGADAMRNADGGIVNYAIGFETLMNNTGSWNMAFGNGALHDNTSGSNNLAVGVSALRDNLTGTDNIAFGGGALENNTTSSWSMAIGREAMQNSVGGSINYAFGYQALYNVTGNSNLGLGHQALRSLAAGSGNIALGYNAGDNLTSGDGNLIIGHNLDFASATGSNQLNIAGLIQSTDYTTGALSMSTSGAGAINIGTGTSTGAITIGNNATDIITMNSANVIDLNWDGGDNFLRLNDNRIMFQVSLLHFYGTTGGVATTKSIATDQSTTQETNSLGISTGDSSQNNTGNIVLFSGVSAGTSRTTGNITIQSGDGTGTTTSSGSITIDTGSATGTAGTISLGATNASGIVLGNSSSAISFGDSALANCTLTTVAGVLTCGIGGSGDILNGGNSGAITIGSNDNSLALEANGTTYYTLTTAGLLQGSNGATLSVPGSGANSEQFGASAQANGDNTVAVGAGATADAESSVAIGASSYANQWGTAIGNGASSIQHGVAIGDGATADSFWGGQFATAVGANSLSYEDGTALGNSAHAGVGGTALGMSSIADGYNAIALGIEAEVTGDGGIAIGGGLTVGANSLNIAGLIQSSNYTTGAIDISTSGAGAINIGTGTYTGAITIGNTSSDTISVNTSGAFRVFYNGGSNSLRLSSANGMQLEAHQLQFYGQDGGVDSYRTIATESMTSPETNSLRVTTGSSTNNSSGNLNLQTGASEGTGDSSGSITIQSGNGGGTGTNSGSITIDVGSATGTAGTISIGSTNASAINIGAGTSTGAITIGNTTSGTVSLNSGDEIALSANGGSDTLTLGSVMTTSVNTFRFSTGGQITTPSQGSSYTYSMALRTGNSGGGVGSGDITIQSGNGTGTNIDSGDVTIDVGTATGTAGSISIGATNASGIILGATGSTVSFGDSAMANCTLTTVAGVLTCGAGGGSSLFTDGGSHTYLTSTTDNLIIGQTSSSTTKLGVVNTTDQTVLTLVANSTQTYPLVLARDSGGGELFSIRSQENTSLFMGRDAGMDLDGGSNYSTAFGQLALANMVSGTANTALGFAALNLQTSGSRNVAVGDSAMRNSSAGDDNVAIGYSALRYNSGSNNIAVGRGALQAELSSPVSGNYNTAVGYNVLNVLASGNGNSGFGVGALRTMTSGSDNVAIGNDAMRGATTGTGNVALGHDALYNSTGDTNIAIGRYAGDNLTSGSNNIVIGAGQDFASTTGSNQLNIAGILTSSDYTSGNLSLQGDLSLGLNEDGEGIISLYGAEGNAATVSALNAFGGTSLQFQASGLNNYIAEFRDCCNLIFAVGNSSTPSAFHTGLEVVDGNLIVDTDTLFVDATNNQVGIGTDTPDSTTILHIDGTVPDVSNNSALLLTPTMSSTTVTQYGARFRPSVAPSIASSQSYYGLLAGPSTSSANLGSSTIIGAHGGPYFSGTGMLSQAIGLRSQVTNASSGTISDAIGFQAQNANNSGTINNNYGIYVQNMTAGTNDYGIYVQGADTYSLWVDDGATRLDGTLAVGGNVTVTGHVLPATDDTYDLGSATHRWRDLYLGPASLHIGVSGNEGVISYNTTSSVFEFSSGVSMLQGGYMNFGSTSGINGYGLRDNGGVLEVKNSGGAWTALVPGAKSASYVVAASDSPAHIKASADYVADGTSDEDEINAALTAAAGGKVYLAEGTFSISSSVLIPNNTTIEGAGKGTIIELNSDTISATAFSNADITTGTGVVMRNLALDGSLGTGIVQVGIRFQGMGSVSGARQGGLIEGVTVTGFSGVGISVNGSDNNVIKNNYAYDNGSSGINVTNGSVNNMVNGNTVNANGSSGISVSSSSTSGNTVTDNTVDGNSSSGIQLNGADYQTVSGNIIKANNVGITFGNDSDSNTVTGNMIISNTTSGMSLNYGSNNIVSDNVLKDNGARGISVASDSSNNLFSDNNIEGATTYGISVTGSYNKLLNNIFSDNGSYAIEISTFSAGYNTIVGNTFSGLYAIQITGGQSNHIEGNSLGGAQVVDFGTDTVYGGQLNASNDYVIDTGGNLVVTGTTTTCTIGNGTGTTACSSDQRLKHNIQGTTDNLAKIAQLTPVSYTWNNDDTATTRIGLIAQDVQLQFPEAVSVDGQGFLQLDYAVLVSPLIGAVQELNIKTDSNTSRIEALETELAVQGQLKVHLQSLEDRVLAVEQGVFAGDITVGGKIITAGNPATAVLGAQASGNSTITISGNDVAGTVTYSTSNSGMATGEQVKITFSSPYGAQPRVTLTPASSGAAAIRYYVERTATEFTIHFIDVPSANATYKFDYQVIQ